MKCRGGRGEQAHRRGHSLGASAGQGTARRPEAAPLPGLCLSSPLTPSPLLSPSWKAGVTGFPEPYSGQDTGGPGAQVGCPVSVSEVGRGHGVFTWRPIYSFT